MLSFPYVPVNGEQLANEIEKAGFTAVAVTVVDERINVRAAELVDPLPPGEERDACEDQAELDDLLAAGAAQAAEANAKAEAVVGPIVARHVPITGPPVMAREDRVTAIVNAATDWKSAVLALSEQGLLAG